jgi:hypothetical protein
MKFIGGFFKFARRVLEAAKKGGLPAIDLKKLDNLLTRTGKRNTVLAKGILSALSAGGASEKDVKRFGELLRTAESRIAENKEPFTKKGNKEISEIFKRAYISDRTSRWFSAKLDELLAEEIKEFIEGSQRIDMGVPSKKTIGIQKKNEKKKAKL